MILLPVLLTLFSWVFWLAAAYLTWDFFRRPPAAPAGSLPPVSILKPVKGLDSGAYQNFASFCRQDYPRFELIFGVADPADPVIPLIERLQRDFPHLAIQLVIANPQAPNQKAGLLAHLARRARFPILVASDSDMRVGPDALRRVIPALQDPAVGLVTCPYRGANPVTLTARLETLYMGVTFLPSMIVGRQLIGMNFAMGALVALRQSDLARMGGFEAISGYLADDFQLGSRISALGLRVHLSRYLVDSQLGETTFSEQWEREVRWAHCNRASRPRHYPGLFLSFSTPLALLVVGLAWFAPWSLALLAGSLLLRWMVGYWVTLCTHDHEARRWLFWLPVRDCLTALIWFGGIFGRRVVWRGQAYQLRSGGRLAPLSRPPARRSPVMFARAFFRALDAALRRVYHIFEFCEDERCLFRLSVEPAKEEVWLTDGVHILPGQPVAIIHFWNEHFPTVPPDGADLAWGLNFHRQVVWSMERLADYTARDPEMRAVLGFHGVPPFGSEGIAGLPPSMMRRWGFDLVPVAELRAVWSGFARFWENFYTMALIWTFNAASLKGKHTLQMRRDQLWISRKSLLEKYAPQPAQPPILVHQDSRGPQGRQGDDG